MNKLKSLVAVFALALAASNVGCVVQGQDAEPVETTGTQTQADIGVGDVAAGVNGAMQISGMISNLALYGNPLISEGTIFGQIQQVRADIAALDLEMEAVQEQLNAQDKLIVGLEASKLVSNVNQLFNGYMQLSQAGNQAELDVFLSGLRKNGANGFGELNWATLETLDVLVVGNAEVKSALDILNANTAKDYNTLQQDRLGRFMASRRLIQDKAFFIMSRAFAGAPEVIAAQSAQQQARYKNQDAKFIAATRAYNAATVENDASSRANAVGACESSAVWRGPAKWSFMDNWNGQRQELGQYVDCSQKRSEFVDARVAERRAIFPTVLPSETLYNVTNLSGTYRTPNGDVIEAKVTGATTLSWANGGSIEMSTGSTARLGMVPGGTPLLVRDASGTAIAWYAVYYNAVGGDVVGISTRNGESFTRE